MIAIANRLKPSKPPSSALFLWPCGKVTLAIDRDGTIRGSVEETIEMLEQRPEVHALTLALLRAIQKAKDT